MWKLIKYLKYHKIVVYSVINTVILTHKRIWVEMGDAMVHERFRSWGVKYDVFCESMHERYRSKSKKKLSFFVFFLVGLERFRSGCQFWYLCDYVYERYRSRGKICTKSYSLNVYVSAKPYCVVSSSQWTVSFMQTFCWWVMSYMNWFMIRSDW